MNKRNLQIATGILAAVPVITGMLGFMGLSDPLYSALNLPHDATLDSNLRFYRSRSGRILAVATYRIRNHVVSCALAHDLHRGARPLAVTYPERRAFPPLCRLYCPGNSGCAILHLVAKQNRP